MKLKINSVIICMLFFLCQTVNASDRVHVEATDNFNSVSPGKTIDVKVLETSVLGSNLLYKDDILHCEILKVVGPKRGKRGAYFTVAPISYISGENTYSISGNYCGKYSARVISKEELKNVDKAQVGKKAVKSIGNHFIKGIAPVASLAEGVIKNEDGNRIESGVKQVYKDSVLSYAEKGKDLELCPGTQFYLIFKPKTNEQSDDSFDDEE